MVAEVGGKKLTAAEVDKIFTELPAQYQQNARLNPSKILMQILMFHYLADEAEKANLDKRPDLKSTLDFQRMVILYQAEINDYKDKIPVSREDQDKMYQGESGPLQAGQSQSDSHLLQRHTG